MIGTSTKKVSKKLKTAKLNEFEKLVAENFVDTADEEVVTGKVVHMTDREAIIDINAKSEGCNLIK